MKGLVGEARNRHVASETLLGSKKDQHEKELMSACAALTEQCKKVAGGDLACEGGSWCKQEDMSKPWEEVLAIYTDGLKKASPAELLRCLSEGEKFAKPMRIHSEFFELRPALTCDGLVAVLKQAAVTKFTACSFRIIIDGLKSPKKLEACRSKMKGEIGAYGASTGVGGPKDWQLVLPTALAAKCMDVIAMKALGT